MGKTFKDRRKFDRKQQVRDEPVRGPARREKHRHTEEDDEDLYDYDDYDDYDDYEY